MQSLGPSHIRKFKRNLYFVSKRCREEWQEESL